jgi:hypothetical protein
VKDDAAPEPELIAYVINPALEMPLVKAQSARAWMDATDIRFANRCLPLLIANQSGWFVLSMHTLRVVWTGGRDLGSLKIEYLAGRPPYPASSHFGDGILTFSLPYLFRTPPGYNLLVRGPSNWPKDGAAPLEGVVETDWSAATFTVNWKLTRSNHLVNFEAGEPICMLVPQRRGELESFRPELRRLDEDTEMHRRHQQWAVDRGRFLSELKVPSSAAAKAGWQKDYFQGVAADRGAVGDHQTKLQLKEFKPSTSASEDRVADPEKPER